MAIKTDGLQYYTGILRQNNLNLLPSTKKLLCQEMSEGKNYLWGKYFLPIHLLGETITELVRTGW